MDGLTKVERFLWAGWVEPINPILQFCGSSDFTVYDLKVEFLNHELGAKRNGDL